MLSIRQPIKSLPRRAATSTKSNTAATSWAMSFGAPSQRRKATASILMKRTLTTSSMKLTSASMQGELNEDHTAITGNDGLAETWTLDGMGNWYIYSTTTTSEYQNRLTNSLNQITDLYSGSGWAQPTYDAAGNMTTIAQPGNETIGMSGVYDAWNRLVQVNTGVIVVNYSYNGLNQRVTATTSTTTTAYYFSASSQDLEERVGTSTVASVQYVYGLRFVNDLVLRDRATGGSGDLGINDSGLNERLYVIQDANWNVVAIVNTSGAVQERFTYTTYGNATVLHADFSATFREQHAELDGPLCWRSD